MPYLRCADWIQRIFHLYEAKFQACSFMAIKVMTFSLILFFSRSNWSVKFWFAFLMNLEKRLLANIDFLKENISNYDTLKIWGIFDAWSTFARNYMKRYQQKSSFLCNFLLTSALFRKVFSHKMTWMAIKFSQMICRFDSP